jgi:hypothetical protein
MSHLITSTAYLNKINKGKNKPDRSRSAPLEPVIVQSPAGAFTVRTNVMQPDCNLQDHLMKTFLNRATKQHRARASATFSVVISEIHRWQANRHTPI